MKLSRLAFVSIAIVLGATSVKAAIGVTTNYSKLSVSITVSTNSAMIVSGNAWEFPVKTIRFGNKQLLNWFAGWDGADRTSEPWRSAQLAIGWDWGGDVLVVDKTGTNVLFDAMGDHDEEVPTHFFYVDFWYQTGANRSSGVYGANGSYAVVETGTAHFELYDQDYYLPYTDLSCYGGNRQNFKQSWDANGAYTNWSDSESAKFPYNGNQVFLNGGPVINGTTATATISAVGKGKGGNLGIAQ